MINTEETYVGDLKQVIEVNTIIDIKSINTELLKLLLLQGYLNSWKNNSLLEDEKLNTLFCNILEIYKFNRYANKYI